MGFTYISDRQVGDCMESTDLSFRVYGDPDNYFKMKKIYPLCKLGLNILSLKLFHHQPGVSGSLDDQAEQRRFSKSFSF